ncbi:MAG: competence/damage-inducible protein A [Kiritimatiellales bacterium]
MKTDIELVSIGTELLSGRTLNSHAQTLGSALSAIGLSLARDTTIPDEIETIQSVVTEAFARTDIVIVSGGLGPTSDDITREALAGLYNRKIVLSPKGLEAMRARFAKRGITMSPVSERMAQILEGAEPLINSAGAAVAQRLFPMVGKVLFIVPGPPSEFAAVLTDHIVPWLCEQFPEATPLELRVLTTEGVGESTIVERLEAIGFQCPEVSVGFYPGLGKVEIRLTAPHDQKKEIEQAERTLREILHDKLIAE